GMFGPKIFREAIACQFLYKGRLLVFRASFRRLWIVALQIGCDHIGEKPQCTCAIGQRVEYFKIYSLTVVSDSKEQGTPTRILSRCASRELFGGYFRSQCAVL